MGVSRREFLTRVGQAGGYSATFAAMQALGIMPMKGQRAEPIRAAVGSGKGTKVVVLGAGIGGLVTAYELRKLGYEVTLLEARERPGGRNFTARNGTKVEFADGTVQTVKWEEGNYQNLGPARLPSTHWTILDYALELKVPLEVEINTSRSALLQNDLANGGKPITMRKAVNDTRGHVSELLAKCVASGGLDKEISKEDRERMMTFLTAYGPLKADGSYDGSDRAGYKISPGAGDQVGVFDPPTDMKTLLDAKFWNAMMTEEVWDWQATMMQPVGGMDAIPYAFAKELGTTIQYGAAVTEIRRKGNGAVVTYEQKGAQKSIEGAYCVIALPFEILKKIPHDLAPDVKEAIDGSAPFGFYKIAWESPRFWERKYNIYGGLSWIAEGCNPIWYPSGGLMKPTGIVVAGYDEEQDRHAWSNFNKSFWNMSIEEKFATSRESVEKLHPGHGRELKNPVFCGWKRMKWNEGSWVKSYGGSNGYEALIKADGPFYFAGDSVSHIAGWQEGAALSARRAVQMINDRVVAAKA